MEQGFFITGTDTNVGKTWATVSLMEYFKNKGKSVIGLKPVASGCEFKNNKLVNADALMLQKHASIKLDYTEVNPYAYELAVSPNLAGKNNPVDLELIVNRFNLTKAKAQIVLVEGAGGWCSPINNNQQNNDLAKSLGLPVIMVVSIRLGCINHALLTCRAIISDEVTCSGWIAVCNVADTDMSDELIQTLDSLLDIPKIGVLPYLASPDFDKLANFVKFTVVKI